MVVQRIKDIDPKSIKSAKGVMAVLELLGISEDDLAYIKEIPGILKELEGLKEFKAKTERTIEAKAANAGAKPVAQIIKDNYLKPNKEFNPHYGRE